MFFYNEEGPSVLPIDGIITDNLVLHLDAGDSNSYPGTGTTWYDLSANQNNGTIVGGAQYTSEYGGGLSFDGSTGYVDFSDLPFRFNDFAHSISVWFFWNNTAQSSKLIGKRKDIPYPQYGITINDGSLYGIAGKKAQAWVRGDTHPGSDTSVLTFDLPNTPQVINLAYSVSKTEFKFYMNGILQTSSTHNLPNATANLPGVNLRIGAQHDNSGNPSSFFNSKIYSAVVYNRSLTDAEVLENFNSTKSRFGL